MSNKDTILELRELGSTLEHLPPQNIYSVPAGYFEGFASQVLSRIKALDTDNAGEELNGLSPFLNSIPKTIPYSVPVGYFEDLDKRMIDAIQQHEDYQSADEELFSLSPLLTSIGKKIPYAVPQGYFENLENNINLKPTTQPAVKVVSMVNRKWFRYAAAAIVIGFVAITGIQFLNNNNSANISSPSAWVEKNMKKVSTDDINNFIQVADESSSDQNNLATSAKTDINDLMKDVSDKDIQDFLSKTSAGSDEADADILLN
ncbi:MAG: hypothetical protein ABUT20_19440 [Bacteroidota bacterium]